MKLIKKILMFLIIMVSVILLTSNKSEALIQGTVTPSDVIGKDVFSLSWLLGRHLQQQSWHWEQGLNNVCTWHHGDGYSDIISSILRLRYDDKIGTIVVDSISNSCRTGKKARGDNEDYGKEILRLAAACTANSFPGQQAEIFNLAGIGPNAPGRRKDREIFAYDSALMTNNLTAPWGVRLDWAWASSGNNKTICEKTTNYHKLEAVDKSNAKVSKDTWKNEEYTKYGPVSLKFGGAGILNIEKIGGVKDGAILLGGENGPTKNLDLNTLNERDSSAPQGKFKKGEGQKFYFWIKNDLVNDNTKEITIKFKQDKFEVRETYWIGCATSSVQSTLTYYPVSKVTEIKGGEVEFKITIDKKTTSIKIVKMDSSATAIEQMDKRIDIEFMVLLPKLRMVSR